MSVDDGVPREPAFSRRAGLKWAAMGGAVAGATMLSPAQAEAAGSAPSIVVDASGGGDYTSIEPAIAAAPPGCEVFVKRGTYVVTSGNMSPAAGVTVAGEGHGSVIRAGNGLNTAIFNLANDNVVLTDLRIDGNGPNQASGNAIRINADYVTVSRCFIHDATDWGVICFENAAHAIVSGNRLYATSPATFTPSGGIELYGAAYCTVAENIVAGARSNGIYLANRTTECHHNTVSGNTITACKHAGILAELGARDNAINGNALDANYTGIWLSNYGSPASGNAVTSNVVDTSTTAGVRLDGVSECVVAQNVIAASGNSGVLATDCRGCALTGNVVRTSSKAGIYLQDTRDSVCSGNVLVNNGQSTSAGNARAGIVLYQTAGACSGNVVSDNRCVDTQSTATQQYGISVLNSAQNNLLATNLLEGNGQTTRALLLSAAAVPETYTIPYRAVAATVGTQVVAVAHGLSYTPVSIDITMTSAGTVWSAQAADNRNVYLKADAAGRTATVTVG